MSIKSDGIWGSKGSCHSDPQRKNIKFAKSTCTDSIAESYICKETNNYLSDKYVDEVHVNFE